MRTISIADLLQRLRDIEPLPKQIAYDDKIYQLNETGDDYYRMGENGEYEVQSFLYGLFSGSTSVTNYINEVVLVVEDNPETRGNRFMRLINGVKEYKELKDTLLFMVNHYGRMEQLKYAQSEVFELNEAIIDYENALKSENVQNFDELRTHIAEEFADVLNMLGQVVLSYDINELEVFNIMRQKLERQKNRVAKEIETDTQG